MYEPITIPVETVRASNIRRGMVILQGTTTRCVEEVRPPVSALVSIKFTDGTVLYTPASQTFTLQSDVHDMWTELKDLRVHQKYTRTRTAQLEEALRLAHADHDAVMVLLGQARKELANARTHDPS